MRLYSAETRDARSWSSQKSGARMRSSSAASCSVSLGGSKIAPQPSKAPGGFLETLAERIQLDECF